ncbi:hypothetical protein OH76DRAFT_1488392 [Lentinus brumalis]|uniref:Uncharacterized protein n=1 Tax=Lentinus brumalis TaxID=2498619 RepID=A0A371CR45_9APHY|nr:hypothetical protein OH76DRAFT_1488392 [Polyporus brumalis]
MQDLKASKIRAHSVGVLVTAHSDNEEHSHPQPVRRGLRDCVILSHPALSLAEFFRVDNVARFIQPATAIYTLGAVPADANWGSGPTLRCLADEYGHPLDIWCVGIVTQVTYNSNLGGTTFTVAIKLVRECDRERLRRLLRRSSPKRRLSNIGTGAVMTASLTLSSDDRTVFRGFYDACAKYQQPALMTKVGVNDFIGGDLVLLQSAFVRRFKDEHHQQWDVEFELTALSMLHAAPRVAKADHDGGFRSQW